MQILQVEEREFSYNWCWNSKFVKVVKTCPFSEEHLDRFLATGVVTSPNFPGNYPNSLEKTETIQVEQGLILLLQFTAFDVESEDGWCDDTLTITDSDGIILMHERCGSTLPPSITSNSNSVNLLFSTTWHGRKTGWSVNWSAVQPGERQHVFLVNLPLSCFLMGIKHL